MKAYFTFNGNSEVIIIKHKYTKRYNSVKYITYF